MRRNRFLRGEFDETVGAKDVTWINASGAEMNDDQWSDDEMRCFGMLIDGRAQPTGIKKRGGDATMLLIFNAATDGVSFVLPECPGGEKWTRLFDTNHSSTEEEVVFSGDAYVVTGRSTVAFSHENSGEAL